MTDQNGLVARTARGAWLTRAFWAVFAVVGAAAIAKLVSRSARFGGDHMCYYLAARGLVEGCSPYLVTCPPHQYVYPLLWAFLLIPLTRLQPDVYAVVWGLVLGGCWVLSSALIKRIVGVCGTVDWRVATLPSLLLLRQIFNGWGLGQTALVLSVLLLLAVIVERRGQTVFVALLVALAGGIKLFPFYMVVLFRARERWSGLIWTLVFSIGLQVLPATVLGWDRFVDIVTKDMLTYGVDSLDVQTLQSDRFSPVATSWRLAGLPSGLSLRIAQVLWMLVCTWVLLKVRPSRGHPSDTLWVGFAFATMIVVTPMVQENYLTLLLLPFAAGLQFALNRVSGDRPRQIVLTGIALSTVLFNIYGPWVVGHATSRKMMAWGFLDAGLMIMWGTFASALYLTRTECRSGDSSGLGSPSLREESDEPVQDGWVLDPNGCTR